MRSPSPLLTTLLSAVAAGILVQAILAGAFISGVANLRLPHTIIGWLLPYVALVPGVVAVIQRRSGLVSTPVAVGAAALPILLWVQEVLGHLPAAASTAVHVPLGVALFGGSISLAVASRRPVPGPPGGA